MTLKVLVNGPESTVIAATFTLYVVYGLRTDIFNWVWSVKNVRSTPDFILCTTTEYSLIIPFCVSAGGGSHEMNIEVELVTDTINDWGGADGAIF